MGDILTQDQLDTAKAVVAVMRPQADALPGNEHVGALADLADLVAALVKEAQAPKA